jgi:hypothetical protein
MAPPAHIGQSQPHRDGEVGTVGGHDRGVWRRAWGLQSAARNNPELICRGSHISHAEIALVRRSEVSETMWLFCGGGEVTVKSRTEAKRALTKPPKHWCLSAREAGSARVMS